MKQIVIFLVLKEIPKSSTSENQLFLELFFVFSDQFCNLFVCNCRCLQLLNLSIELIGFKLTRFRFHYFSITLFAKFRETAQIRFVFIRIKFRITFYMIFNLATKRYRQVVLLLRCNEIYFCSRYGTYGYELIFLNELQTRK